MVYHLAVFKTLPEPRLITPLSKLEMELGIPLEVDLKEAMRYHSEGTAIFVDARPYRDYAKGHIKGAINIYPQDQEEKIEEGIRNLPKDIGIIVYCDGIACELSKELALRLIMKGYDNVKVLLDGWSRWLKASGPVEGT